MMLSRETFVDSFTKLALTFPSFEATNAAMNAYYVALRERIGDEDFVRVCQHLALDDREFFPRPAEFMKALEPDVTHESRREFALVMRGWGPYDERMDFPTLRLEVVEGLSDRARVAIQSVGLARLAGSSRDTRDQDFLYRRWEAAYCGEADEIQRRLRVGSGEGPRRIGGAVNEASRALSGGGR